MYLQASLYLKASVHFSLLERVAASKQDSEALWKVFPF